MGSFPVALISAISDDIHRATGKGLSYFESCPNLCPDFSHLEAAAYSLAQSYKKKFVSSVTAEQDKTALDKFLACNSLCETWEFLPVTSGDEELLGTIKMELWKFFNPKGRPLIDDLNRPFSEGRNGPGAAIGADGGDFYTKLFSSKLTSGSQTLIGNYEANIKSLPSWYDAELIRKEQLGGPDIVDSSRLSFVPKNDKTSRVICIEPVLNMFYQLGIGQIMTRHLRSRFGIDLETQADVNRVLARAGSELAPWVTIDLESASDTISLKMCREFLPKELMLVLELCRSKTCNIKGSTTTMHMISSMGNGFTFPLQTIIFACVVKAVYSTLGLPFLTGSKVTFGVFGDDIVIYRAAWHRVIRCLALLGFKVNTTKSFSEGPFRESCGRDYFKGRNIRGLYIRRLDNLQDFYAVINACVEFSARSGLYLPKTCAWLRARVDQSIEIPCWEDPSSGIRTPLCMVKTRRFDRSTFGMYYTKYVPKKRSITIGDGYIYADRKGRRRIYNPSGLLVALLSGQALSSGLPLRLATSEIKWKKKRGSCSYWDSLPPDSTITGGFDWQQYRTAAYINLLM